MIRPRSVHSALRIVWIAVLLTMPARSATPDLRTAQGRLEDQLVEGEIDPEDFLAWHFGPGRSMGTAGGAAYVGLETFLAQKASGGADWGAMLVLELPLERFARPRGILVPTAGALPREPLGALVPTAPILGDMHSDAGGAWLGSAPEQEPPADGRIFLSQAGDVPSRPAIAESAAQTAAPRMERAAPAPAIFVTTEVARSCVRAALRAMGLADDHRLDSVASRARSSAALPELRLRAVRTLGESGRVSLSEDDPSRYVASGAATNVLEARVTFRLDRLLFADEEIVVERARLDRSEQRLRVTAKVLQALFDWQKAYAQLQDSTLSSEDRLSTLLREAESTAILDMMTGGWFGAYRAALAARGL